MRTPKKNDNVNGGNKDESLSIGLNGLLDGNLSYLVQNLSTLKGTPKRTSKRAPNGLTPEKTLKRISKGTPKGTPKRSTPKRVSSNSLLGNPLINPKITESSLLSISTPKKNYRQSNLDSLINSSSKKIDNNQNIELDLNQKQTVSILNHDNNDNDNSEIDKENNDSQHETMTENAIIESHKPNKQEKKSKNILKRKRISKNEPRIKKHNTKRLKKSSPSTSSFRSNPDLEINLNRLNKFYNPNKSPNEKITSIDILTQILNDFFSNNENFNSESPLNQSLIKNFSNNIQDHFNKLNDNNLLINNNLLVNLKDLNKRKNSIRQQIYDLRLKHKKIQQNVQHLRSQNLKKRNEYLIDKNLSKNLNNLRENFNKNKNKSKNNDIHDSNQKTLFNDINVKIIHLSQRTNPHFGLIDKIKLLNKKLKKYI
ncbi:uncharacterized protein ASCRUDRAFT_7871 [Ascoidea rubescens DSM 1968]|uniref:Inner kinetochore subunit AME1 domain-containing protein n=1 Tax=Ascoidea rubescens DSM 1968 TaxID=1344418 RepID=A0A1D2VJ87_9ASCO|nr:hypothetical protein ASCRUDRAFT_7871 [Ascoidea rubescens DSM 1968]ODV61675.1 hypothetical protein ASCRUDRAFT_7871 [Ascoidea rubescens DSM 1968]